MPLPKQDIAALSTTWTEGVLLKRDVFSTVERGRFRTSDGEVEAVLRRLDQVPWWSYLPARHLFERERKALTRARDLNVGPKLLWGGRSALPRRRCASCIAPASATTISPRSRTGCAAATAVRI